MNPPQNMHRRQGAWMAIGKVGGKEQDKWLDTKRKFFVWKNRKSIADHSSLGFQYLTTVQVDQSEVADASRFLKVEIFHTGAGGEVFLQYTGVLKENGDALELQNYIKHPQFVLSASVHDVKTVCEREFDRFGDYRLIGNNCQTFTSKVLKQLQTRYKEDIHAEPGAAAHPSMSPADMEALKQGKIDWARAESTKSALQTSTGGFA